MRRSIARRRGQSSTDGGSPMDSGGEGSGTNRGFENYPGGMEGAAAVRPPWYRALTTGGLSPSDDEDGDDGGDDAASEEHLDPIQLPESTHSLLFTEPVGSLPFMYGFAIFLLSFACLVLAFAYNIQEPVPYNVTTSVRVAQYLSIVIAIVSEEGEQTIIFAQGANDHISCKFCNLRGQRNSNWSLPLEDDKQAISSAEVSTDGLQQICQLCGSSHRSWIFVPRKCK